MKTNKLIFLFCILMSMLATNASAYDIAVKNADGVMIYYKYNNNKTEAYVTYETDSYNSYSGSVVIPKEITYKNKTLKVTNIGREAFRNCSNLTSVTIPNSVTSIGSSAFNDCKCLKSVTIPNSVTSIGESAFAGCSNLTSVTIGNGVKSIESGTFFFCRSLPSVTIPNSVTSIGRTAFYECNSLTSVTIPNSVMSIGECAFYNCSTLKSVTIPNRVTSIGSSAFYGCKCLKSVTIPNSVTSIENTAFSYCSALTSIIVEKNNPIYDSRNNCNAIIETKSNKLISGCKNTFIPNNITNIGYGAFLGSNLESITIPNSVTSIGGSAFRRSGLKSITIPNSVNSIGDMAFYECINLKSVTSKITKPFTIKENTFSNYTFYGPAYLTLYVPKGTVAKYKATEDWKNFKNILEEGTTTGIDEVEADNSLNTSKRIYDSNGKRLPATSLDELPSGLYIVNGKKVVK